MRYIPAAIFFVLCAVFALLILQKPEQNTLPSPLVSKAFPATELQKLNGETELLALNGRVTIVNIFASWCVPCAAEHPLWAGVKVGADVELIGIGWKDTPERLNAWLEKYGNPYQHVYVDAKGEHTISLGITGIPETYVIDKKGIIRKKYAMPLTEDLVRDKLLPLLKILETE